MKDQHTDTILTPEHELIEQRRQKLKTWRDLGLAYPNHFKRSHLAADVIHKYENSTPEELESTPIKVSCAGRILLKRNMGKASFVQIQDSSERIQLYVRQDVLGEEKYEQFISYDLGDILGVQGTVFKTKTGELSIRANEVELLVKSLRPLPDKYHGLTDVEARYRKRYLDLMVNPDTRRTFRLRSEIIHFIRNYLLEKDFLEVETPMMQTLAGGAAARPFITHHNALDMELYMRIAPELFLKRLVVGGFEKVFEINRNFRNEGLSTRHNPEFTMLEFYQAYSTYSDLIALTEDLLSKLVKMVFNSEEIKYQNHTIQFKAPLTRLTMTEAILQYNPDLNPFDLTDFDKLLSYCNLKKLSTHNLDNVARLQLEIFEKTVEHQLIQPTFITAYPTEVSPLARKNDKNPDITDRFELFIGGQEIANGFSELNDADDQAMRFKEQIKAKASGDQEAMPYDQDYITALEYGLPPTAGEGIGIDRLVMLLTDNPSIKDVILFPLMRPEEG